MRDEGLRAGIERFGEFANILFLKLLGEIEDLKEEQGEVFLVSRDFRWSHWKNKKGDELLRFVNDTVLKETGRVFQDLNIFTPLAIKNPTILKKIIDKLEPLKLINIDSDIKGDSFEYFLKQSTATKNDLGEYFTPRHIVKAMVKLVNPQFGERVYDPFCGTGGMLIESFRHIYNNMPRNERNLKILREETVFGNEITSTARITKMNMILIGDGHSGIQQKNSLADPNSIEEKYDIVITNMPYSQKTDYGSYYDLPSNRGDSVCIQHCIKSIDKTSENGRIAVIVPEGILFRKDMQKTREYLLDRCYLKSVISLPQGAFLPYTGVKTNILYCTDIKKKRKQEKFWYFDVKNDGYSLDSHRRKIEGTNDLQKFLAYRNTDVQEKMDILEIGFSEISMEEVKKNDLILSGNRYRKTLDYSNIPWEVYELGEVCDIFNGSTPSTKTKQYWQNGTIPWFTIDDIREQGRIITKTQKFVTKEGFNNSSLKLLPKDTVLLCCTASVGEYAINDIELTTNQQFNGLVIKENFLKKLLPKFLFWVVVNIKPELENNISSSFSYVSVGKLKKIKIPVPPIEIQQEIVAELDSYQNIINHARGIIKDYKPKIEVKKEWNFYKLSDLTTIRPQKSEINGLDPNTDVSFIPMVDIVERSPDIKLHQTKKISETYSGYTYFKDNDVLLAKITPCFENGKSGIAKNLVNGIGFGSTEFIVIRPNNKILPEWIYYFISQDIFLNLGASMMTGSAGQQRINLNFVSNYKIPLPSLIVQKQEIKRLKSEKVLIENNKEIIRTFENKINKKLNFIWGK